MDTKRKFISGASLFTGEQIINNVALVLHEGVIEALISPHEIPADSIIEELPDHCLLAPGFIDAQVNGAGGILFNDTPTPQAIKNIGKTLRTFGVTGYLPTFITDRKDKMHQACAALVEESRSSDSMALGIHLEGPFISVERKGIHNPDFIRSPDKDDIHALIQLSTQLEQHRVLLTIAPETVPVEVVAQLARAGVIISVGHTASSYNDVLESFSAGATGFTHLFNAMPPIYNREPGPVGAALSQRKSFCGIIVDGFHVHPALLRIALNSKEQGSLFLVTDAMPPVGTDVSEFFLYGKRILRSNGRLVSEDGVLAGADVTNIQLVRNCHTLLNLPLEESLRMASLYPAQFLKLDHRFGRIAKGYQADFVLLSNWTKPGDLRVENTWLKGESL